MADWYNFSKWQIFHKKPGYANTNSNIEAFNASFIKYFLYYLCSPH